MINPFDLPSLWKAVRNFSLTFAVVFASGLLGFSVTGLLRRALGELSLPWLLLWLLPTVLIAVIARYESRIIRNPVLRRQIAVVVLLAAVGVHTVLVRLRRQLAPAEPPVATSPALRSDDTGAGPAREAGDPSEPRETTVPQRRGPRSK
jgi:hypothetical protein